MIKGIKTPILDKTGHSYSGISDAIRNDDNGKVLFEELNKAYGEQKNNVDKLYKQLEIEKCKRDILVGDFLHILNSLKKDEIIFTI